MANEELIAQLKALPAGASKAVEEALKAFPDDVKNLLIKTAVVGASAALDYLALHVKDVDFGRLSGMVVIFVQILAAELKKVLVNLAQDSPDFTPLSPLT